MFSFVGYNFSFDQDALNPVLTDLNNITQVQLQNGIFNHINVTSDATMPYSSTIPTEWDIYTIMDCNFNGNINAGNVGFLLEHISSIKVKHRKKGSFDWIALYEIPINTIEDLKFNVQDFFCACSQDYEIALVPTLNGIEGNYIINSIFSEFNGVFICDSESIYKFYAGVGYGTSAQVQRMGVFEPLGRKYPIVIANAETNYQTGSITGTVMPPNYENDSVIDRAAIVKTRELLNKFFTNKRAKIIKDWNGNIWLVVLMQDIATNFDNNFGMGMMSINANWLEQGNVDVQEDMYKNALTKVVE